MHYITYAEFKIMQTTCLNNTRISNNTFIQLGKCISKSLDGRQQYINNFFMTTLMENIYMCIYEVNTYYIFNLFVNAENACVSHSKT